jgi:hypothetical protein
MGVDEEQPYYEERPYYANNPVDAVVVEVRNPVARHHTMNRGGEPDYSPTNQGTPSVSRYHARVTNGTTNQHPCHISATSNLTGRIKLC